jgi:hypothetical protein
MFSPCNANTPAGHLLGDARRAWSNVVLFCGMTVLAGGFLDSPDLQGDIVVTERLSRQYVEYSGGFAIDGESGSAGINALLPGLYPTTLSFSGSHHAEGNYAGHEWSYDVGWALSQSWATTSNTLHAEGSMTLIATGTDTFGMGGWNNQEMYFDVSETTDYDLTGFISGNQTVDFQVYNEQFGFWHRLYLAYGNPLNFSKTGTLDPGLYRIINNPYSFTADGNAQPVNNWSWTIGFQNGQVSAAVPEPASAFTVTGLTGLLLLRRRWRGPRRTF